MRNALLRSLISASLIALFGILAFSAAPAFAAEAECEGCAPWWHLTSESRPAVIQPGSAKDEVQEVTISGTAGESFVLSAVVSSGEPPYTILKVGATPAEVQAGLDH